MKTSAVNPPFLRRFSRGQRSPAVTRSGTLYYPIWLSYAVGALESAGHEVDLVDAPASDLDEDSVLRRVSGHGSRLVILESSTPSIESDTAFADRLAEDGRTVILVGTHPSALPRETLASGRSFQAVAVGEYDLTVRLAADALAGGEATGLRSVPGLLLRTGGEPFDTGPCRRLEDLDSLPFVSSVYARHLDTRRYSNPNALHPMVMVMGGRGCPNSCSFCLFPQTLTGRSMRTRSVSNIVDEVLWVRDNMPGIRAVFFEDDTISADRTRLRSLADALVDAGSPLRWTANMRADVDYETLCACRRAGLRTVCTGFESGDPGMLAAMRKGLDVATMNRFAHDAERAGVLVHGCFLFGAPGETRESMQRTLDFALSLPLYTAQFYPLMVYPGTEAYEEASAEGRIVPSCFRDWLSPEGLHTAVVRTGELSASDISAFCDHARRRFYLRPGYVAGTIARTIADPAERSRTLKAFSTFWRFLLPGRR